MIGDVSLPENCEIIVTSAKLVIGPSVSVIIITFAPRDLHSLMLASIRGKVSSEGATAITEYLPLSKRLAHALIPHRDTLGREVGNLHHFQGPSLTKGLIAPFL